MITERHNLALRSGNISKIVIAPRRFIVDNGRIRYIHIIDSYCTYVQVFDHLRYVNNTCVLVAFAERLKLYSNTKGLYFNYSYWVDNNTKKKVRIYLCD